MTGKELVLATYHHKNTDTLPWVPFAGVHAGKLKGYNAKEICSDGEKLLESILEVNKIYHPDGQPVMFDLQLEAEVLGCDLVWSETGPPTVASHPLENEKSIPTESDVTAKGRFPMVLDVTKRFVEAVEGNTAVFGLLCGPFTLASHLRGTNIFMDMFDDEDYVHKLLDFTTKVAEKVAEAYSKAGVDIIASVDPLVSQISPDHFTQFLSAPYTRLFDSIQNLGNLSSFFVCGDATKNIEVMCKTGPDGISIDENINMVSAKAITDRYNVTIGGNIPLTTVMLFGNQQDNMKTVVELIDSVDSHNLVISPGCDMPYDCPIESSIAIEQAVHQTDSTRELIKNYESATFDIEIDLPEYDSLQRPLVEVFTIDSETCAACTYMFQSAVDAKKKYGEGIDIVEYKITKKENIARIQKMGVKQLPSIYVNGELAFESIIPSRDELNRVIEKVMA